MENAGAVFFPASGFREVKEVKFYNSSRTGYYWLADASKEKTAYGFYGLSCGVGSALGLSRYYGYSVRLVQDN